MPQKQLPAAFFTYAHADNRDQKLTKLRKALSDTVQMVTGEEFPVFQDHDIEWGENWKQRIDGALDASTFLIAILSPSFFRSQQCRREVERFLERERQLQREDLILAVYYVDAPKMNDAAERSEDPVAQKLAERQYADWRKLRVKGIKTEKVQSRLMELAKQVADALKRASPAPAPPPAPEDLSGAGRAGTTETATAQKPPGPGAQKEPYTVIVDPSGGGHHRTISDAVRAARAGSRIRVGPGRYTEGLVIDKPLEIVGEGEPGQAVLEATGSDVILFRTTMGRVAHLTLRQAGGGNWFGVDIVQGRLQLEDCDITSQSLACVAIHTGADPILRRNRIHDGKQPGVFVFENGRGVLEDNELYGNEMAGVEIKEGANPTLRRNRIYGGQQAGVYVHKNGGGLLEDNDIFENALAGVEVEEGANPTLRRNRIRDGRQVGMLVINNGLGLFEENDVYGNVLAGVEVRTGGNPTLRRNHIRDGKSSGVYVNENGRGLFEENDISANALSGVQISEGASPTLRRNQVRDGKGCGVFISKDGLGTLEENHILGNALTGVEVRDGGNPTVRGNVIRGHRFEAVYVHDGGRGTFSNNDLRGNDKGAWDIAEDCLALVTRDANQE